MISPALAKLVAQHGFATTSYSSAPPTLVVPEPRERVCPECYHAGLRPAKYAFRDDWTCSNCELRSTLFTEFSTCPDCKLRRQVRYDKNTVTYQGCGCGLSEEGQVKRAREQARLQQELAERDERAKAEAHLERVRAQNAEQERQMGAVWRKAADLCWKSRNERCKLAKASQFPFCGQCQRFRKIR